MSNIIKNTYPPKESTYALFKENERVIVSPKYMGSDIYISVCINDFYKGTLPIDSSVTTVYFWDKTFTRGSSCQPMGSHSDLYYHSDEQELFKMGKCENYAQAEDLYPFFVNGNKTWINSSVLLMPSQARKIQAIHGMPIKFKNFCYKGMRLMMSRPLSDRGVMDLLDSLKSKKGAKRSLEKGLESTTAAIKNGSFKIDNPEKVDLYLRARHDMLEDSIAQDLTIETHGDVSVQEIFGLKNLYRLTPDLVICKETTKDKGILRGIFKEAHETIIIADVFVSDKALVSSIRKKAKYMKLVEKLRREKMLTGRKVVFKSFGLELMQGHTTFNHKLYPTSNMLLEALVRFHNKNCKNIEYEASRLAYMEGYETNFQYHHLSLFFPEVKSFSPLEHINRPEAPDQEKIKPGYMQYREIKDQICSDMNKEELMEHLKREIRVGQTELLGELGEKYQMSDMEERATVLLKKSESLKEVKIPKLVKVFPLPHELMDKEMYLPEIWNISDRSRLEDGTILFRRSKKSHQVKEICREGIPFSKSVGMETLKLLKAMLESTRDPMIINSSQEAVEMFKKTEFYRSSMMIQEMFIELSRLVNRRHVHKATRKNVYKFYENLGYGMEVKSGSHLTKEKIIQYKLHCFRMEKTHSCYEGFFHSWHMNKDGGYSTSWLSVTLSDFNHYLRLKDRMVSCFSGIVSDIIEEGGPTHSREIFNRENISIMLGIILEHKRPTSTCSQLNRYLMVSYMSFLSDRDKLIDEVWANPIRSRLQMLVMWKQTEFCLKKLSLPYTERVKKLSPEGETDYDRSFVPSMMGQGEEEFGVIMWEMYFGNLLNKESGFQGHRVGPMIEKTAKEEKAFREKVERKNEGLFGMGPTSYSSNRKTYHEFDEKIVCYAASLIGREITKSLRPISILRKLLEPMNKLCTMKSSVEKERSFDQEEVRSTAAETQSKIMLELNAVSILDVMAMREDMSLYFGMFSKSQIGGPREILIQRMTDRAVIRSFEGIFELFSKVIPEEMISKRDMKGPIQMNATGNLKRLKENKAWGSSQVMYFNKDHSRWSPSASILCYQVFVSSLGLPKSMTHWMISILGAFGNKLQALPSALWSRMKREQYDTGSEILDWVRSEVLDKEGVLPVYSGFGQGMLQFFSSFYHCAQRKLEWKIFKEMVSKRFNVQMISLISSDDRTDILQVEKKVGKLSQKELYMVTCVKWSVENIICKMLNMHNNGKKSGISPVLCEFNSLFSIYRRAIQAKLKSSYNACDVPDLSMPDVAVREMISSERRLLEEGSKIDHLMTVRSLNSQFLESAYMNKEIKETSKRILNSYEAPFCIGHLPEDRVVESILFGPEVYLCKDMSQEERHFWSSYYSVPDDLIEDEVSLLLMDTASLGRDAIRLKNRMNKQLENKKKSMLEAFPGLEVEELVEQLPAVKYLNIPSEQFRFEKLRYYISSLKRTYSENDSMRVHSMIRAMSYHGSSIRSRSTDYDGVGVVQYINNLISREPSVWIEDQPFMRRMEVVMETSGKIKMSTLSTNPKRYSRHTKLRTISILDLENVEVMSEWSLLQSIYKEDSNLNRKERTAISSFKSYMAIPQEMKVMSWCMQVKSQPHSFLIRSVQSYLKQTRLKLTTMICEEPDSGTLEGLLSMIFRYRSHPFKIYPSSGTMTPVVGLADDITTCVSLSKGLDEAEEAINSIDWARTPDIKITDRSKGKALVVATMKNAYYRKSIVSQTTLGRIYYSAKEGSHNYLTNGLICIFDYLRNRVHWYIWDDSYKSSVESLVRKDSLYSPDSLEIEPMEEIHHRVDVEMISSGILFKRNHWCLQEVWQVEDQQINFVLLKEGYGANHIMKKNFKESFHDNPIIKATSKPETLTKKELIEAHKVAVGADISFDFQKKDDPYSSAEAFFSQFLGGSLEDMEDMSSFMAASKVVENSEPFFESYEEEDIGSFSMSTMDTTAMFSMEELEKLEEIADIQEEQSLDYEERELENHLLSIRSHLLWELRKRQHEICEINLSTLIMAFNRGLKAQVSKEEMVGTIMSTGIKNCEEIGLSSIDERLVVYFFSRILEKMCGTKVDWGNLHKYKARNWKMIEALKVEEDFEW